MRKLSARMRTEQEIRQSLRKAEYSVDETEAAIAELKSYGYLHDERYCREYFLYAKARGKADARIVREIAQKGISAETARNVIERQRMRAGLWMTTPQRLLSRVRCCVDNGKTARPQTINFLRASGVGWQVWAMIAV